MSAAKRRRALAGIGGISDAAMAQVLDFVRDNPEVDCAGVCVRRAPHGRGDFTAYLDIAHVSGDNRMPRCPN